jgi:hypothetical protein
MKTILSLVATTGLLIGSAAIAYAQHGSTPTGAAPSGSAGPSGTLPGQQMQGRSDRERNGLIVAPGAGERRVEERDRTRRNCGQDDVTIGRGDRGGCATQTYVVPSEKTGDKTSVDVTRC